MMLDPGNNWREFEDVFGGVQCQCALRKLVQQASKTGLDWASSTLVVNESHENTLDVIGV